MQEKRKKEKIEMITNYIQQTRRKELETKTM